MSAEKSRAGPETFPHYRNQYDFLSGQRFLIIIVRPSGKLNPVDVGRYFIILGCVCYDFGIFCLFNNFYCVVYLIVMGF